MQEVKRWREAEITHGRVSMLAALVSSDSHMHTSVLVQLSTGCIPRRMSHHWSRCLML